MLDSIMAFVQSLPLYVTLPVALVTAVVAALALYTAFKLVQLRYSPLAQLPSPYEDQHWLLGSLPIIIREPAVAPQMKWTKKLGPTMWYRRFGWVNVVLTSDPDLVQKVLVKNAKNYPKPRQILKQMKNVVGDGLLTTEGAYHKKQRSMLSSHFQFTNLTSIFPVFVKKAAEMAAVWQGKVGSTINVNERMANLTLDVIGTSGFGFEFGAVEQPDGELATAFKNILPSLSFWTILNAVAPRIVQRLPIAALARQKQAKLTVQEKVREIVALKVAQAKADEAAGKPHEAHSSLLDIMLHDTYRDGTKMTPEELQAQTLTFMIAGHETTSNALTWAFMLLDKHPEVLAKMRQEIDREFPGDTVESMTADDLHRLPYLWAVVQEVLRLYPPAPLTNRRVAADDVWEVEGKKVTIPKGTLVFISPFVMHRLKQYWGEDAEEFRPERWYLDEAMTVKLKPKMFTYMPFIFGQRSCIGQRFALMEMQAILAVLVSRFELKATPDMKWRRKLTITMRPFPDLQMTIQRRGAAAGSEE